MTEISDEQGDDVIRLMRSHGYFHGLREDLLETVASHLAIRRFDTGDVVYRSGEPVVEVGFLVTGRLKGVIVDAQGVERLLRFANRGEAIGLIGAALAEPMPITVFAVEPSRVLMLEYEKALELTAEYPELRAHWSQHLARSIRSQLLGDTRMTETSIVVIFNHASRASSLLPRIVDRLTELGETVGVFTDTDVVSVPTGIRTRRLLEDGRWLSGGAIHEQIGEWGKPRRILIDVDAAIDSGRAASLIGLAHRVLWIAEDSNHADAVHRLRSLEAQSPEIRDKVAFVWVLGVEPHSPFSPELSDVAATDFKVLAGEPAAPFGATASFGFERLIHHLRGLRVGLALGGGAAKGMAHLGVLRALENHGIVVDRIAGTSAGAMTGLLYAAGFAPDYLVECFTKDLQPSWLFRNIPRGDYWYLTYKYRRGQFDPMLRKYLSDRRIEQLPIPSAAITVDLVSGNALVRDSGDTVYAILESINLPLLSRPILRDGRALIDGGFVNNVPADVLVSQGCNFVIAVDVVAKIERHFAGIDPETPAGKANAPNSIQTLLRTYAVQSFNMTSVGMQPADVQIEPDTTSFGMPEFTRAAEMANIGEQAANQQIATILKLLGNLEGRLG